MIGRLARRGRAALQAWQAFHADLATQIALAHALVGVPALLLVLNAGIRWLGFPLPLAAQAVVAVALYAAIRIRWRLGLGTVPRRTVAITAAALTAAWLVSAMLYDTSWDGTSYHLPATLMIASGWNPIAASSGIPPLDVQTNGLWTIRAALFALTPGIEGTKALDLAFMLAALFTLVPAWSQLRRRALTGLELALLYGAVGNPVALGQVFTFYVDGVVYESGLLLLGALLLTGSPYRRAALGLAASAILLLTGAKLTGIYYAGALTVLGLLADWRRIAAPARVVALALGALALGVAAIGFRPYVTNLRDYGHLVELGAGGQIGRPEALLHMSPPEMLLVSVLSRTDVAPASSLKSPVLVTPHELASMGAPDPRFGGFGPLFALEFLAALLAAGLAIARARAATPALVLAAGLAAMTAIFPEPWSARYVPFFWGVPIFLALGCTDGGSSLARRCAVVVIALALVNGGLALTGNLARTALGNLRLHGLFVTLAGEHAKILIVPIPYRGFEVTAAYRLAEAHIPFRIGAPEDPNEADSAQCDKTIGVDRIRYCLPRSPVE